MEQDYQNLNDAAMAGMGIIFMLIFFALVAISIIALWKVFTKAGKPGWASLIPIYNIIVLLEIVGKPIWWIFVLLLIPIVNFVFMIIVFNELSKSFGKGIGFTIGLVLLNPIFIAILAFGSSKYIGPSGNQNLNL